MDVHCPAINIKEYRYPNPAPDFFSLLMLLAASSIHTNLQSSQPTTKSHGSHLPSANCVISKQAQYWTRSL